MNGDNSINNFPINDKPSKGPILGTVIIVLIIIIGGIYIITSKSGEAPIIPPTDNAPIDTPPPATLTPPPTGAEANQAALAGLGSVESDLNASEADLQILETEVE